MRRRLQKVSITSFYCRYTYIWSTLHMCLKYRLLYSQFIGLSVWTSSLSPAAPNMDQVYLRDRFSLHSYHNWSNRDPVDIRCQSCGRLWGADFVRVYFNPCWFKKQWTIRGLIDTSLIYDIKLWFQICVVASICKMNFFLSACSSSSVLDLETDMISKRGKNWWFKKKSCWVCLGNCRYTKVGSRKPALK